MQKYIYGLVDPRDDKIRYVGASFKPRKRIGVKLARDNPAKKAWLEDLTASGLRPHVYIIETVNSEDDWIERERYWIAHFRGFGWLLNIASGGPGRPGAPLSAETREKMSAAQKGKKKNHTPDGLAALREKGAEASRRFWENPTEAQLAAIAEATRRGWDKISPEERSRRASERNRNAWASYTEEERAARQNAMREGQLARPKAERSRSARAGGYASSAKHPGAGGRGVKAWWASLTPEQRQYEIDRRSGPRRRNQEHSK